MNDSAKDILKAINKAADLLARRNHSEKELRDKLSRFFEAPVIEAAIAEAWERRWILPPEELAESAARSWSRAGKSARYINEQLKRRGLPMVSADADAELEKMRALLKRKFKNWEDSQSALNYEERTQAYRYLKYRGFADALIRKVIHEEP